MKLRTYCLLRVFFSNLSKKKKKNGNKITLRILLARRKPIYIICFYHIVVHVRIYVLMMDEDLPECEGEEGKEGMSSKHYQSFADLLKSSFESLQ